MDSLAKLEKSIIRCRRCPRLVQWRRQVSQQKRAAFLEQAYWGRPLPGFGDPQARLLIVGLAPAAHGANRTGRMFTGDRSGDWLYRALFKAGFANQSTSTSRDDGLQLKRVYISAVVRCAPPANKPLPTERDNCLPFLWQELQRLHRCQLIVALGGFAWDGVLRMLHRVGHTKKPKPRFAHGHLVSIGPYQLIGSYHPSQQNTFTGKLTQPMFDAIFVQAKIALR